jgi:stress-induced morphogen
MTVNKVELETKLRNHFPEADIVINDLAGDDEHYSLEIASSVFKGKSKIEQHKLVNQALKGFLGTTLHALMIKTIIKN